MRRLLRVPWLASLASGLGRLWLRVAAALRGAFFVLSEWWRRSRLRGIWPVLSIALAVAMLALWSHAGGEGIWADLMAGSGAKPRTPSEAIALPTGDRALLADSAPAEDAVWISGSGTRFHAVSSCSGMKAARALPERIALMNGYTACGRCLPAQVEDIQH